MTREEAKREFWKQNGVFEKGLATNYKKIIKSYFIGSEFDRFIDKIYDNFESMICKNCKYFRGMNIDNDIACEKLDGLKYLPEGTNENNFGCNKFERKNDG